MPPSGGWGDADPSLWRFGPGDGQRQEGHFDGEGHATRSPYPRNLIDDATVRDEIERHKNF